ncbi:hypothetical protein ACVR1G_08285 [Streptococcus dentasini]
MIIIVEWIAKLVEWLLDLLNHVTNWFGNFLQAPWWFDLILGVTLLGVTAIEISQRGNRS